MNKLIFEIGMRRSGTSILRELIKLHPKVHDILFEPHELLFVCQTIHISRYRNNNYHKKVMNIFKKNYDNKWFGAKLALNAGIEAMNWKWLDEKFNNPFYVFIKRNPRDTYNSWIKIEKSKRGIISYDLYYSFWKHITNSFEKFVKNNKNRSCLIQYENLLDNTDYEMNKIWKLLKLHPLKELNRYIKNPTHRSKNG